LKVELLIIKKGLISANWVAATYDESNEDMNCLILISFQKKYKFLKESLFKF
jgi:hypothetical protein